jgi:hypothetical protein
MSRHFDVVGHDAHGQPIFQLTEGDDLDGDDIEGSIMGEVGRGRARRRRAVRQLSLPPKPDWRNQLAPGVIQPDEGLVPLTLSGQAGAPAGTFSATVPSITFQGQLQKPFRPERLLTSTVRTGASAVGRLITQLFVGTDLQQAEVAGWDAELIGAANAFGTRLTCKAAEPGVFIRAIVTLSTGLTGTDTIFANLTFLGRVIH